ncbi:hypothetical protein BH09BAC1_BH09BAC1_04950 [soil metagenome]
MQKQELKALAQEVSKSTGSKVVYATADGNCFIEENLNAAKDYARKTSQQLEKFDFNKAEPDTDDPYSEQTNAELMKLITERKIELGTAKKKVELVALLVADDTNNQSTDNPSTNN